MKETRGNHTHIKHAEASSRQRRRPGGSSLHLFVLLQVPHLHLTLKVPKSSQNQDVTLRTEDRIGVCVSGQRSTVSAALKRPHL